MSPRSWRERLLDASSDLITVHEADGTFRFANAASERLFGLAPEELIGSNPFRLLHPDDRDGVIEAMLRLRDEPSATHSFLVRARHGDGSWRHVEAVARNQLGDPDVRGVVVVSRDVTDRVTAQDALASSEERHRNLVESAPFGIAVLDGDDVLRFVNQSAAQLLGATDRVTGVQGRRITDFVDADECSTLLAAVAQAVVDRRVREPFECHVLRPDDRRVTVMITPVPYEWEGRPAAMLIAQDVTDLRLAEERRDQADAQLAGHAALLQGVLEALTAQTAVVDRTGTIIEVNRAWTQFSRDHGGTPESTGVGVDVLAVCGRAQGVDQPYADAAAHGLRAVLEGHSSGYAQDVTCTPPNADPLYFSLQIAPLHRPEGGAVLSYSDITERKALEVEAAHRALHDELTGLPNRALLLDRIEHALRERSRSDLALLFIDLDQFKLINDGYGHQAGDEVLRELARRLLAAVRPADTVARLAGDEFVVLCERLPFPSEAYRLAQRMLDSVAEPFQVGGTQLALGASIGIAAAEDRSLTADELLRAADQAMFEAKARGRHQFALYDDGVHQRSTARVEQALALRRLVETDRLTVHYQPIVDLRDGHVTGVEALLRWRGAATAPDPALSVELAEETGLINEIGHRVLRQALRQAAGFRRRDGRALPLSVNLAPQQVDSLLTDTVIDAARAAGYPLTSLTLELTERTLMAEVPGSIDLLRDLRDLGVRIAVDDFGAGYSSLAYLRDLPLDALKIHGDFVHALSDDPDDDRIISAIIQLGRTLKLRVVAEGVETEGQRRRLVTLGCTRGQGFLFGAAQPAESIAHRSD